MWYLILPPVVVVLCLSFLLWYLSRKGADPAIAEKMSLLEQTEGKADKASFLRTKEFLLRILEKTTQKFKIRSLQMHNALNDWAQSIKARRMKVQESVLLQQPEKKSIASRIGFRARLRKMTHLEDKYVSTGLIHEEHDPKRKDLATPQANFVSNLPMDSQVYERPMVSETAAEPEVKRKRVYDVSREDALVARIAANPKDFMAYEELGDQYLEAGNIKDAKECYRQVLKLSPVQRLVKVKIRRLERLFSEQNPE